MRRATKARRRATLTGRQLPGPAVIPLPAGAPLPIGALAVLALLRRRAWAFSAISDASALACASA